MFKKDFIEVTAMKARRKMRLMRIDPYPNAIIRWGLHKREPGETTEPVLEEAMIVRATLALAQNSLQHSDSLQLWGPELGC